MSCCYHFKGHEWIRVPFFCFCVSVHVWHFGPDDRSSRQWLQTSWTKKKRQKKYTKISPHWSVPSQYVFSFAVYNLLIVVSGFEPRPSVCGFFHHATTNSKALMTGWSLSTGLISLAYHSEASGFIYLFFFLQAASTLLGKKSCWRQKGAVQKRRAQKKCFLLLVLRDKTGKWDIDHNLIFFFSILFLFW